ncbi:DUF5130 family protein [Gordonia sp. X0973]|uniref:DUF5130 family protein n=1 Tax=Gordonia sp. X0973 TaxID=2742602 RepID=UPI000F51E92A|nr:DUF5130 family protein [Gordonia sp. X0973]QKT06946.1 DUF5130 family protein [Gordonia sp. X0973]
MASGDLVVSAPVGDLPTGTVVTNSGRISATRFPDAEVPGFPFTPKELEKLDEALKDCSEKARVRFSVYLGDLGADPVASAREILLKAPEPAHGTLIAVSPNSQDIAVVSGSEVAGRVNDRVAALGVTAAAGSFRRGDLIDGLVSALRVMTTAAVAP